MGTVFIIGKEENFLDELYVEELKQKILKLPEKKAHLVELKLKSYLREEFLVKTQKNFSEIYVKDFSNAFKSPRLSGLLKSNLPFYPTKVIAVGSLDENICSFLKNLYDKTGAELYLLPFKKPLTHSLEKCTFLSVSKFSQIQLLKTDRPVKNISGPFCLNLNPEAKPLPCPPANFGMFVFSKNEFDLYKIILTAVSRLKYDARLIVVTDKNFTQLLLDYASLKNLEKILKIFTVSDANEIKEAFSLVQAVISSDEGLYPTAGVLGISLGKFVIAFEDSSSKELAEKTSKVVIPLKLEEIIYEELSRFIDQYDSLDFSKVVGLREELSAPDFLLNLS